MQIIKAIESMNKWTSDVMTSWVEYHIHRCTITIIPLELLGLESQKLISKRTGDTLLSGAS